MLTLRPSLPHVVDGDLDNLYYADEPEEPPLPCKKVPSGDIYEASRAGDVARLQILLKQGVNVNIRDSWDSVALYYACLAGHLDAARMLMEHGAICSENTFDGDRCHYAALNLRVRKLLKAFEARPPPLDPLPKSLRELFLSSKSNLRYLEGASSSVSVDQDIHTSLINSTGFNPDIIFYVEGQPIEAHRAVLVARSPFFKAKFGSDWKQKREVRLSNKKLTFPALFSLIQFFYTDRLDVAVEDMEDLSRICKVCGCLGLQKVIDKELAHQKFAEYKNMRNADDSQKRFILQGSSLPEHERLPDAMRNLLNLSLLKSKHGFPTKNNVEIMQATSVVRNGDRCMLEEEPEATSNVVNVDFAQDDHADVLFIVDEAMFRSHQVILAARSDYFRTRFCRMKGFREENLDAIETKGDPLPVLKEQDLSAETFETLLEYMYTDQVLHLNPNQAEDLFDAASRYLLFPLKRVAADALLPHLETATPEELCQWLLLAELYGVWKLREYCLDAMAANFEVFSETREFRKMLLSLPPPSGDSSHRTTAPSAPGGESNAKQANVLDDLREKWLEAEGAELDKRDESARQFDKMLELLVETAKAEACDNVNTGDLNFESLGL